MIHGQTSFSELMDVVPMMDVGASNDPDLYLPPNPPPSEQASAAIGEDIFAEALALPPPPSMWDSCFELELLDMEALDEPPPATPDLEFKPPAASDPITFMASKLTCATPTKNNKRGAASGQSSPRSVACKIDSADGVLAAAAKAPKAPKASKIVVGASDDMIATSEEKKRMERMQRNRESAATSRKRKKEKVEELEGLIARLDETARALKAQNTELRRGIAEASIASGGGGHGMMGVSVMGPPPAAPPKLSCANEAVAGSRAVALLPTLPVANSAAGA